MKKNKNKKFLIKPVTRLIKVVTRAFNKSPKEK